MKAVEGEKTKAVGEAAGEAEKVGKVEEPTAVWRKRTSSGSVASGGEVDDEKAGGRAAVWRKQPERRGRGGEKAAKAAGKAAEERWEKRKKRAGGGMQVEAGRRIRNRLQINDINDGYLCCRLRRKPGRGRDHGRGCCRGSMPKPTKNLCLTFLIIFNYGNH